MFDKRFTYYLFILLWMAIITGCSHDPVMAPVPEPGDGETQVTFSMQLPGNYAPQSKALDPADESHVETVEVLVFEKDGNFKYVSYANDITVTDNHVHTFTVTLRTGACDLMILANSRKWLEAAFPASIPEGITPQEIREALVVQSGKWNALPGDPDYVPIPMWGERKNTTITPATSFTGPTDRIKLTRMLARIDVAVHADLQSDFTLKEIYLYNPYDNGTIIPSASPAVWDADENQALLPSIPDSWTSTGSSYQYADTEITETDIASKGAMYTFEAPAGTAAAHDKNTCLVVGGEYKGVMTYYRLDFVKTASDGTVDYLPLLRNHIYTVTIQSIASPGLASYAEAFRSKPMNIEAEIVTRNDGAITHYVYDGQYYIGCDPAEKELWSAAVTGQIRITTDWPEEWTATVSETAEGTGVGSPATDWLTITPPATQNGIGATDVLEYALEENTTGAERTAYLILKAGRLTLPVKITQQPWYIESVTLDPVGELLAAGETRTVIITGSFDDIPIRAWNLTTGLKVDENTVPGSIGFSTATLEIPEFNEVGGLNVIAFEYYHAVEKEWKVIRTDDQPGIDFVLEAVEPDGYQLARSRENLAFTVTGNWPRLYIRAYDGTQEISDVIELNPANGEHSGEVVMHKNPTETVRNVWLQWSADGITWTTVFTGTQKGYFIDLKTSHTNGTNFIKYGEKITVTIDGDYPKVSVQLTTNGILQQTIIFEDGNTPQSDVLKLKNNPAAVPRPVSIDYAPNTVGPFIPFCTGNQPSGFAETKGDHRRWIASVDVNLNGTSGAGTMTWAEGMGIDPAWNNQSFFFQSYGGTSHNLEYPQTKTTGCAAYSEEIFGPGMWYMASSNHMTWIYEQRSTHSLNMKGTNYWTATENGSQSYYFNMATGSTGGSYLTTRNTLLNVRCVMIPQDE